MNSPNDTKDIVEVHCYVLSVREFIVVLSWQQFQDTGRNVWKFCYKSSTVTMNSPNDMKDVQWSHWRIVEWRSATLKKKPSYDWCDFWNHKYSLMFEHVTALQFLPSGSPDVLGKLYTYRWWIPAGHCSWSLSRRSRSSVVWEESRSTGWCAALIACGSLPGGRFGPQGRPATWHQYPEL